MRRRKKIKHLGRKRKLSKKTKRKIYDVIKVIIFIAVVLLVSRVGTSMKSLYKESDVEKSKVEYYVDIADEISKGKAQVNWQELLAIDLVKYKGDLSNIRKIDVINIGKRFIEKNKESYTGYSIKPIDEVLKELNFNKNQQLQVHKELKELKYISISGIDLSKNSKYGKFIDNLSKQAILNYREYVILPSITVGQAILESGWGESQLTQKSNNLFGIKADNRWDGKSVNVQTGENYNETVVASFRAYSSIEDSIKDHCEFLNINSRYTENGVFESKDYKEQAQALEDAGYSTKENEKGEKIYADILIDVIKKYNLQLLDHKAQLNDN